MVAITISCSPVPTGSVPFAYRGGRRHTFIAERSPQKRSPCFSGFNTHPHLCLLRSLSLRLAGSLKMHRGRRMWRSLHALSLTCYGVEWAVWCLGTRSLRSTCSVLFESWVFLYILFFSSILFYSCFFFVFFWSLAFQLNLVLRRVEGMLFLSICTRSGLDHAANL
jgi:hypothetical protein